MALLDENGAVIEQYQWEPYGSLATLDVTGSPRPDNSVGHQGLFFYSFNTADSLTLNALGLYHNRNRWYSPSLGRFTSRDPNETAQLVIGTMLMNGQSLMIVAGAFDASGHCGDGINLFVLQTNPLLSRDPLGLFNYLEMATVSGTQAIIGGMVGGVVSKAFGGSFWEGFAGGFLAGGLGGAAGFLANSAFAASASGLFGTVVARIGVGGIDGFISGYAQSVYLNGNDFGYNVADAVFGAAIGAATGGMVDLGGRSLRILLNKTRSGAAAILTKKILRQMASRGWTEEMIEEAISGGQTFKAVNKATGNSATRYVHPTTGQSVVIDDVTSEVIHVGGPGFVYGPGSGDI